MPRPIVLVLITLTMIGGAGCARFGERLSAYLNPEEIFSGEGSEFSKALRGDIRTFDGANRAAENSTVRNVMAKSFFMLLAESAAQPNDADRAQLALQAGISLSDNLCSEWFRKLGAAQSKVSANRNIVSNIGALTAALMGFAGAGSAAVGSVAGGFGFAENTFESEAANFIVAPSVAQVQDAIVKLRGNEAEALSSESVNRYKALRRLIRYNDTCSHNAVKAYVEQSLSQNANTLLGGAPPAAKAFDATYADAIGQELSRLVVGSPAIGPQDVYGLYAILIQKISDSCAADLVQRYQNAGILNPQGMPALRDQAKMGRFNQLLLSARLASGFEASIAGVCPAAATPAPPAPGVAAPATPSAPQTPPAGSGATAPAPPSGGSAPPMPPSGSPTATAPRPPAPPAGTLQPPPRSGAPKRIPGTIF